MSNQSKWKPITGEIKRKVLVTNNLKGMDAYGNMSHVWLEEYVHAGTYKGLDGKTEDRGEYWALDGPCNLTHYCEVPQYQPLHIRKAQATKTKKLRGERGGE